ncbi:uncharacterized protein LOC119284121, partial [Triticum dicoccoides]|uniref:uncharacterized protein LOC119284121 n=1 Tax=Triticum dicoccoides TaxID=85692 RepID=UPI00188E3B47
MSRQWMYDDRCSLEFINGVHTFLLAAEANKRADGFMPCPCVGCKNGHSYSTSRTIHVHLFESGFMPHYNVWTKHGEIGVMMEDNEEEEDDDGYPGHGFPEYDDTTMGDEAEPAMQEEAEEEASDEPADDLGRAIADAKRNCASDLERTKLQRMLEDHKKLLYPNCEADKKKLGTTLELLQWKAENGVSDKGFGKLLVMIKNMLPKDNELPESTYEAKKVVCPLGLEVQKIHACPNDCILYRGEYEDLNACPVCGALRYKISRDDPGDVEGERPRKKIPTKVMWYAPIIPRLKRLFQNKEHAKAMRWHAKDRKKDGKLRVPADGSQWRKIERKYWEEFAGDPRNVWFGLSADGINPFGEQSPKQPGNDIDVYLRPLVEELLQLWNGTYVRAWDENMGEEFDLKALLFVTINDWPALSNLSGQTSKGYHGCTHCLDDTDSIYLNSCKKNVYLGHHRFLPSRHLVRKKGKHFKGEVDHRTKPRHRIGADVHDMVKDLKVIFGKSPAGQPVPKDADGREPMWKKKSIFWDLPYWKDLEQRMHGKDGIHQGQASYALTKEEKEIFFEYLLSMKVPSGFSSNIKGIINMAEKKFQNLKSHDCHVIMTQLLLVALRGLLPENVRLAIVKLCAFLNAISEKVIDPEIIPRLQNDLVQCLVSFELVFPPAFFNIMTHVLVHLCEEINVLGPIFLHNMFPFERLMRVLNKYVHNRARPEGSISKGHEYEEVIEFCIDFIPDLKPIGVPESRHKGRLEGKGTLGGHQIICMDGHSLTEAHYTVLQNSALVAPYMEEHKNSNIMTFKGYQINGNTFYTIAQDKKSTNQNSGVRFDATTNTGKETYYGYIEDIWELNYGSGYLKVPLFRCKWVNMTRGGVTEDPQYGMTTVDLNNLAYADEPFVLANDVAHVFYVKDMSTRPRKRKDKEADGSYDEPKRHIVLSGKRNIVGVDDKTDMSEDYEKFDEIAPFTVNIDPSIQLNDEDFPWLRRKGTHAKK